jgi:hypothetical protein
MPRRFRFQPSSAALGHIALAAIGLILVAPLLQASPLCTDDGALHIFRTVALDRALGDGLLYPRWFPDLAFGYGFPFFNYREPLGYYVIEAIHKLGADFPLALNLVLALGVIGAGQAMVLWISDLFDEAAGFIAGLIYMAAPYTLIGALTRANQPEVLALALLPLILWAFRRLMIYGRRRDFALAVLTYAALLLTHNISSLIFTPILIAYCVLSIAYLPRRTPHAARITALTIVISLALTAFFWLPALAEGNAVQLYLTHATRGNDYHFNFVSLGEVLGGPGTSDPLLLNPPLRLILGWPQLALAGLGLLAIRQLQTREQRVHVAAGAVLLIGLVFMALPVSVGVWDNLPLIRFVQFPWRFIGRALLPAALLAGAATYALSHSSVGIAQRPSRIHQTTRRALFVVTGLVPLIFAAPQLYPRVCAPQPNLSISDVFAYERSTGHIGVDPLGAYLPVTVKERPTSSPLEAQYADQQVIRRFDRSALPSGATVIAETYQPNRAAIDLDTPIGFRAIYLTFDFPGWQVTIDNHAVPITPSDPTGLITFDVPAGRHHIEVAFTDTPIRTAANAISVAAVLGFVASLAMLHRGMNSPANSAKSAKADWLWLSVPAIFALIKLTLIDPQLTSLRQTQLHGDQLAEVTQIGLDFGDQMRLLGYTLMPQTAPAGETVRVDLYWRALRPMNTNYQTTVGIVDEAGEIWSPKTVERPRDYQDYPVTSAWPVGAYVVDSFDLPILPGTPPGQYSIYAEVFTRDTLQPLPAATSAAHPSSRPLAAIIASLDVTHAARTFNADELGIYNFRLDQSAAPDLKLLGLNVDRIDVLPGDNVLLTFFWQAAQSPAQDYTLTLELIDAPGARRVFGETKTIGGRHPTTQWPSGEQIVDLIRVHVPADLAGGLYRWRGSIEGKVIFEVGELRVAEIDRTYIEPPLEHRIDQPLGGQITLLGYNGADCTGRGADCLLTLVWRDEQDMPVSYKVFVQLLDAGGVPRAQVDAVPVNGTRPTTSWLPGEIITDPHVLKLPADLPAGPYRLVTGLYQELNNTRLKLPDGSDLVELSTLEIAP